MTGKGRNLNYFLLFCALISGVIFYGCGGGGSNTTTSVPLQITGNVASSIPMNSGFGNPSLRGSYTASATEVYLEMSRAQYSTITDGRGKFLLASVPAGSHRVVARYVFPDGVVHKARSGEFAVSGNGNKPVNTESLLLEPAIASISGRLFKSDGAPVSNGRLSIWGEEFFTDSDGYFITPPMLIGSVEGIIPMIPGFDKTPIEVLFTNNPIFIEPVIVEDNATNRSPQVSLEADEYNIDQDEMIDLTGMFVDPDEGDMLSKSYWSYEVISPDKGAFIATDSTTATWRAPYADTMATITYMAYDNSGLSAKASVLITIGTGDYKPNIPPVISDIVVDEMIYSGGYYTFEVIATDADGDTLNATWSATTDGNYGVGKFIVSSPSLRQDWEAPMLGMVDEEVSVRITATVDDKRGGTVSFSKDIIITLDPEQVNNTAPVATIIKPVENNIFLRRSQMTVEASATDSEDGTLDGARFSWELDLDFGGGSSEQQFSEGEKSFVVLLPDRPATCTLKVIVSDRFQATNEKIVKFRVNAMPEVTITSPVANTNHAVGSDVSFEANVFDVEASIPGNEIPDSDIIWTFSESTGIAGPKTGRAFSISGIKSGVGHTAKVEVTDSMNEKATAQVTFSVINLGPVMEIDLRPIPSYAAIDTADKRIAIPSGTNTRFSGKGKGYDSTSATDWNILASTMIWKYDYASSMNEAAKGVNYFDRAFDIANGMEVTIELTGNDSDGTASSTERTFVINATPSVKIVEPNPEFKRYDSGSNITFKAEASDLDPSETFAAIWTSDMDGNFGSGLELSYSGLATGVHNISCEVTDSFGFASKSSEICKFIVNTLPVATITVTTDQYATGTDNIAIFISTEHSQAIDFAVAPKDPDGDDNQVNVAWYYNKDASAINTTNSLNLNYPFPPSIATITAKLYDKFALGDGGKYIDYASNSTSISVQTLQMWSRPYTSIKGIYSGESVDKITYKSGTTNDFELMVNNISTTSIASQSHFRTFKFNDSTGSEHISTGTMYLTASHTYTHRLSSIITGVIGGSERLTLGIRESDNAVVVQRFNGNDKFKESFLGLEIDDTVDIAVNNSAGFFYQCYADGVRVFNMEDTSSLPPRKLAANLLNFNGITRIRYNFGAASNDATVFIVDGGNQRIVRYREGLTTEIAPINCKPSTPIDVAFSGPYAFVLDNTGIITVYDNTINNVPPVKLMSFGDKAVSGIGKFAGAKAIYCSGPDLFIVGTTDLKIIRSGMSNWLK